MRRIFAIAVSCAVLACALAAQTPGAGLATPPEGARHFVIQSVAARHGDSWIWVTPDGVRRGRETFNLRGQVFDVDSSGKAGSDGMPAGITIRGTTPQGDAGETFTIDNGTARWRSPVDAGSAPYARPAFYSSQGGPIDQFAWLLEALLARPDKTLDLLPGGRARATKLTDLQVGSGITAQTVTLWELTGLGTSPTSVWADANNRFFGLTFGLAWLPEAYAGEQARLEDAQTKAMAAQAPVLYKKLVTVPAHPVAFVGVRLFDAEKLRFLADQTVVVDKGAIAAVGARTSVKIPAGAKVTDGRGKTLAARSKWSRSSTRPRPTDSSESSSMARSIRRGCPRRLPKPTGWGFTCTATFPAGIRPMDAIDDGYDELTHINWVIMQAMPDEVVKQSNGMMRFEGPGRYAKDVNLDGPEMKRIVATMAQKHIFNDPTMVAFEGLYVPENGDLSPAYAPFVGTMPPATERGLRGGGFAVPKDLTRADYRASFAKMLDLLGRMHRAGVPIVAGTDGSGLELIHELEIYQQAGFTPAEALAAATIEPARLLGREASTGSITVGKAADLALVDGDPSARIGDLRRTRVVMLDGTLLDADALRTAAGFSGPPR